MSIPAGEENGFWVAEAKAISAPAYWTGRHHEDGQIMFTGDIRQAMRFPSRETCQAMIKKYGLEAILVAIEHMWFLTEE